MGFLKREWMVMGGLKTKVRPSIQGTDLKMYS